MPSGSGQQGQAAGDQSHKVSDDETPRLATVHVPDDSTWLPTSAGDVFVDSVIRHPTTGDAVRVVAIFDTTIVDPDGQGAWWQRARVPAREFTLAPDGMYPENVVVPIAKSTMVDRLDRLYSDLPAPHPPAGGGAEPRQRKPVAPRDEAARRERLEQFHDTLSEQVLTLTSSTAWTDWLRTAARFHAYSFGNTIAIWSQRPDAIQVAGYRTWQSLGRKVRKGEQGIQILAPVTRRRGDETDQADQPGRAGKTGWASSPGGSGRPGQAGGGSETGTQLAAPRRVVGVRIAHVFDISQTDGDPLPGSDRDRPALLTGQAPEYLWDGLALQVAEAGFRLSLETPPGAANGLTSFAERHVLVRPELEDAQRVKTLAHELGHVSLHEPADVLDRRALVCRGQREVEAESVAFLVTSAHGMETGQYSFPYVAGWAQHQGGDVEATLRQSGARALTTAHRILDRLDRDTSDPGDLAEDAIPAHLHAWRPADTPDGVQARNDHYRARRQQPPATGVGR